MTVPAGHSYVYQRPLAAVEARIAEQEMDVVRTLLKVAGEDGGARHHMRAGTTR